MSLLNMDPGHEIAVIEMGMNHLGELTELNKIAEPDVVMCTMVGRGHLAGLGSIEGVARAKTEIYEHAPESAMMIFNLENEHTRKMYERFSKERPAAKILTFAGLQYAREQGLLHQAQGSHHRAPVTLESATAWPELDVAFEVVSMEPESMHVRGEIQGVGGETDVAVFGRHNITNLMAAAAFGLASGMTPAEIWKALPRCKTVWGRNQWVQLENGARVLFDGYNANPESMSAAVENFAALKAPGRKFAVLGEMLEMGEHASEVHRELGAKIAKSGVDGVCFFGASKAEFEAGLKSGGFQKTSFISDRYEHSLAPRMLPVLQVGDIVLMKGSRGMQLEKALVDLKPVDFQAKK
jgi:UDP-N-acetylmuramoyl-tripeptide--D-alanyl-D-alanine ligase